MFIGERPGKQENLKQQVFCGPTGEELNQTYLPLAGLRREEVRVENVVRCWEDGNETPKLPLIQSCSRHFLPRQLSRCGPDWVVLMGASACSIADFPIRLDFHHGVPQYGTVLNGAWEGWVWPMYHPSSGMHDTRNMTALLQDFERLGEWLEGRGEGADPREKGGGAEYKEYKLIWAEQELDQYLAREWQGELLAVDTESHGREPWSVQFSHTPGTGRMIRYENRSVMRLFAQRVVELNPVLAFHFAAHDLDELERMGVGGRLRWRDTMQEAFHQGDLPQGLKPLAYRLLRAEMRSWEDVVRPASVEKLQDWLERALALAMANLTERVRKKLKTKVKVEGRASAIESIATHVLTHMAKDEGYDPWEALDRFMTEGLRKKKPEGWQIEYLHAELGAPPILGIGNCAIEDAVAYGCSDADYTLRVAGELEKRRGGKRYRVFEGDRDETV